MLLLVHRVPLTDGDFDRSRRIQPTLDLLQGHRIGTIERFVAVLPTALTRNLWHRFCSKERTLYPNWEVVSLLEIVGTIQHLLQFSLGVGNRSAVKFHGELDRLFASAHVRRVHLIEFLRCTSHVKRLQFEVTSHIPAVWSRSRIVQVESVNVLTAIVFANTLNGTRLADIRHDMVAHAESILDGTLDQTGVPLNFLQVASEFLLLRVLSISDVLIRTNRLHRSA